MATPELIACKRDQSKRGTVAVARSAQGGADFAGEERIAAVAARNGDPLRLGECADSETARGREPVLIAGACERLEEGEAVARGALAEAVVLLVAVRARTPGTR